MIQEIRIKNFMSFKDEVVISFEATKDTFAEDSQVVKINDKTRLLRFAVVYGYNASGKSNLLKAIEFLRMFWLKKPIDMNQETGVTPFKLDAHTPNEHTKFEMIFFIENTKYSYSLELDRKLVYAEKLSYYKTEQPIRLFDRCFQNGQSVISFNNALKISKIVSESITVNCLKNMSFFAARDQVNTNIPLIDVAKNYLHNNIISSLTPSLDISPLSKLFFINEEVSSFLLNFLREADFNITNLKTEMDTKRLSSYINDFNSLLTKTDILADKTNEFVKYIGTTKAWFIHSVENENGIENYSFNFDGGEESLGTLKTLSVIIILLIKGFHAIDEIETSLHPKLVEKILYEYLKDKDSRSQLIVTTHNDGLLDLTDDLIRKDSVWFTEKQKNGSTELYKLTDFRGINRLSSIREAYRNKRFGATMNN